MFRRSSFTGKVLSSHDQALNIGWSQNVRLNTTFPIFNIFSSIKAAGEAWDIKVVNAQSVLQRCNYMCVTWKSLIGFLTVLYDRLSWRAYHLRGRFRNYWPSSLLTNEIELSVSAPCKSRGIWDFQRNWLRRLQSKDSLLHELKHNGTVLRWHWVYYPPIRFCEMYS